jgi:hypothetical protein
MLGCGRGSALDAGLALGIELAAGRGWPPPSSVIQPSARTLNVNRKLPSSMANPLTPSSMPDPTTPDCPPADQQPAVRWFGRIREKRRPMGEFRVFLRGPPRMRVSTGRA